MKTKSAAVITIKDAPKMSAKGKRNIASWMRRQAKFLENNADKLADRYIARYMY